VGSGLGGLEGAGSAVRHVGRLGWDGDRGSVRGPPARYLGATSSSCLPQLFGSGAPSREKQKVFESWRKWLSRRPLPWVVGGTGAAENRGAAGAMGKATEEPLRDSGEELLILMN